LLCDFLLIQEFYIGLGVPYFSIHVFAALFLLLNVGSPYNSNFVFNDLFNILDDYNGTSTPYRDLSVVFIFLFILSF